jgi:hypothetical protein
MSAERSTMTTMTAHAADEVLTQAEELGYSHRDIAALREVLAAGVSREVSWTRVAS